MKEKLHIIKLGGNVIDHESSLMEFLQAFSNVQGNKILVHGGGKVASQLGKQLHIEPVFIEGRRVTDEKTLKLVTMVYAGLMNKSIVALLQSMNTKAIGLSGADGDLISAVKRPSLPVDYGYAGDVQPEGVNTGLLNSLIELGLTPVICPITHNKNGDLLNTNADTIASVVAIAMNEIYDVALTYCFELPGVLLSVDEPSSLIRKLNRPLYSELKVNGSIKGGIQPKLEACLHSADNGVKTVKICQANMIDMIESDEIICTEILC